jgi:hypothetical protein
MTIDNHVPPYRFQVTNYGLGGLCESHADPHGYLEGLDLPPERQHLVYTGKFCIFRQYG